MKIIFVSARIDFFEKTIASIKKFFGEDNPHQIISATGVDAITLIPATGRCIVILSPVICKPGEGGTDVTIAFIADLREKNPLAQIVLYSDDFFDLLMRLKSTEQSSFEWINYVTTSNPHDVLFRKITNLLEGEEISAHHSG